MIFYNNAHKIFYYDLIAKCKVNDTYHKALFYTLGIDKDCRNHIHDLYDFNNHHIKISGLEKAWQTSGSYQASLFGYNLFNGFVYEDSLIASTPYHLFASEYGAFFIEAVKLRYPEYTKMKNLYSMEK